MQDNGKLEPRGLIDLKRYAVGAPKTEQGRKAIEIFGADLRDKGFCQLVDFLRPEAVKALCAEANGLASRANYTLKECNAYFTKRDPTLPDNDARNIMTPRCLGMVAGDLIPLEGGLQTLYRWGPLRRFLSAILGQGEVHTLADPYQALNISVMPEGPGHNWHFDDPDFVVTLMLQQPERGGAFEFVPALRTPDDENYDGVREVLLGARDKVRIIPFQPGTLMIFRGRYTLHRVSPVEGRRPRLVAILSYSTQRNFMGSALANRLVYGDRVA